jgi:hypothetical protein
MVSLGIPIFLVETIVYGVSPKATDAVSLIVGFAGISIGYTIYKDYLKKSINGSMSAAAMQTKKVMLVREVTWVLLLPLFGLLGVIFAVVAYSSNDWSIIFAMGALCFSTFFYFVWRINVFRNKYGSGFMGPIALPQLFADITGGKFFYFLIMINAFVTMLIILMPILFAAK